MKDTLRSVFDHAKNYSKLVLEFGFAVLEAAAFITGVTVAIVCTVAFGAVAVMALLLLLKAVLFVFATAGYVLTGIMLGSVVYVMLLAKREIVA